MGEMSPDLVHAAGFRIYFYQRIARGDVGVGRKTEFRRGQRPVICYSLLKGAVFLFQRIIDLSLFFGVAANDGEIGFVDLSCGKQMLEGGVGVFVERKQQHSAGFAVQAMSGKYMLPHLIAQNLHGKFRRIAGQRAAVHQQPCGFVYCQQVLVTI